MSLVLSLRCSAPAALAMNHPFPRCCSSFHQSYNHSSGPIIQLSLALWEAPVLAHTHVHRFDSAQAARQGRAGNAWKSEDHLQVLNTRDILPFYSFKPLFALLSDLGKVTEPLLPNMADTLTDLSLTVRGCDIQTRSHGQELPSDTVSPPKAWLFWHLANKAIIFWKVRLNYCSHSVSLFLNTHICLARSYSDKDVTQFLLSEFTLQLYPSHLQACCS